jgi:hypothetical protein
MGNNKGKKEAAKAATKTAAKVPAASVSGVGARLLSVDTASVPIAVAVTLVAFWATTKIYEQYVWWSQRDEGMREVLFESESALYYSYMKDVIDAPSLFAGIKSLIWHTGTENPYTMNVIQRFNIFQEILFGMIWRVWPFSYPADPITMYKDCIFLLWSMGMGWMYMTSVRLTRNLLSGVVALALLAGNWVDSGRPCHLPPLRENQSIPLLFMQVLVLTNTFRRVEETGEPALSRREMVVIVLATATYMLPWQLSHTLMMVETLAVLALYLLGCIGPATAAPIFLSFLGALGCVMVMHFGGNAMFFWNSNFAQACCALLIIFYAAKKVAALRKLWYPPVDGFANVLTRIGYILGNLALFFGMWYCVRFCFECVVMSDEEKHIREFLRARFGFVKDFSKLDEALSVRQYLSDSVYSYLPDNMRDNLIRHWMIPSLAVVTVLVLISLVHDVLLNNGKRKVKKDDDEAQAPPPAKWADPSQVFLLLLNIAFCTMAAVMMRNLSIAGPFCALFCSTMFGEPLWKGVLSSIAPAKGSAARVGVPVVLSLAFIVGLFTLTDAWEPFGFKLFGSIYNNAPAFGTEYDKLDVIELNWWIKTHTKPDAVFIGDMKTSSQIKCGSKRPITCHPQYESKDVRFRDRQYNQIFGKRTIDEIHEIMLSLKGDYLMLPLQSCHMAFADGTSMSTMTNEALKETVGQEKYDEVYAGNPNWCSTLGTLLDNESPYFTVEYVNARYMVMRVLPKSQREEGTRKMSYQDMVETDPVDKGQMMCDLAGFYASRQMSDNAEAHSWFGKAAALGPGKGVPTSCGCRLLTKLQAPPEAYVKLDWARNKTDFNDLFCVGEAAYGAEQMKDIEKAKELYKLATVITPEDKQQWYNYAGFLSDFGTAAESEAAFFRSGEAIRGTAAVQVSTNCIYAQKIYSKSKAKAAAAMRDAIFWKERADKQNEYDKNCIDSYLAGKSSLPKGFHTKH